MTYAAVLGHQPHLSIAELAAVIPGFDLKDFLFKQVALFESSEELDPEIMDDLGGTVLLAMQLTEENLSVEDIPGILANEVTKVRGKVTFGLRCYGLSPKIIKLLYRRCKDRLKRNERSCRYVGNEKKPAATVLLHDAEMLTGKKGCELFIMNIAEDDDSTLWIGKTIAAQDVDWYSWLDMEKPVRDTTVGLLPPKLAQILLNFGGWLFRESEIGNRESEDDFPVVFDPFCGTGVIPMECLNREWDVLASDISQKAVNGCKKNLDWLRKEEKILKKDVESTVWKQDATKPFELKELPDVIVTETSLGPALEKKPSQRDVSKMKTENEKLQALFLKNAAETLPGVPIVCTWPVWMMKGEKVYLEKVWKVIDELGYQPVLPAHVEPHTTGRFSMLYKRKDQFVGREIVLLKAKA